MKGVLSAGCAIALLLVVGGGNSDAVTQLLAAAAWGLTRLLLLLAGGVVVLVAALAGAWWLARLAWARHTAPAVPAKPVQRSPDMAPIPAPIPVEDRQDWTACELCGATERVGPVVTARGRLLTLCPVCGGDRTKETSP